MRRLLSVLCSCTVGLIAVLALSSTEAWAGKNGNSGGGGKVCLCHVPPGNPGNAHEICVGAPAVQAHLGHGDYLGECTSASSDVCGGASGATCPTGQFCKRDEGFCSNAAEGTCAAFPASCPTTAAPVCGCDSVTYDNACLADKAGAAILHSGACACPSSEVTCGGTAGVTCETGQFCKRPDGACTADAEGVCTPSPADCPSGVALVCGCDGTTYSNACFADAAGVPVKATGACAMGTACGGTGGATCATGQFCLPPVGTCTAGAAGLCVPIPQICSDNINPVCGCNGTTYDNACNAVAASVAINHTGACEGSQAACGGAAGTACATGFFCSRPEGACAADAAGVCAEIPVNCPATITPVCGCNGTTYDNACVANAAGVAIQSQGDCPPAP
jgi:hypothetical protein